tara:strand:+ start:2065 stop:2406 length:342 start_codon:yes stop_codon:yes gene_type:complete
MQQYRLFQYQGLLWDFIDIMHSGSLGYDSSKFFYYENVATINAENLDCVSGIVNGADTPPNFFPHAECRSLKVGDIVMDDQKKFFMCDPVGWTEVEVPSMYKDVAPDLWGADA